MPTVVIRYSHEERAERRKKIADFVKANGGDVAKAVAEFGVSRELVLSACRGHGVDYKKGKPMSAYAMVATLILDNPPDAEVARKHGVTKQRVNMIRKELRRVQIPLGIRGLLNGSKAHSKLKLKKG